MPEGDFPTRKAIALLAVVGLAWGVISYLRRAPEGLDAFATETALALANNDQSYLKTMTTPETQEDLAKWSDLVRPQLESLKKQSPGGELDVSVVVIDQNRKQRTGLVSAFLTPSAGAGGDASVTSRDSGPRAHPLELPLHWVLDRWGKWRLDGRMTLLSAPNPERTKRLRPR
jgi:hypothetical protein